MLRQTLQELMQTVTDKCFLKCVTKPSGSLTGSEQSCLAKCVDRYVDTMNIISRTLIEKQEVRSPPRKILSPSTCEKTKQLEEEERDTENITADNVSFFIPRSLPSA